MAKLNVPSVDFRAIQAEIRDQFTGLNPNDPSQWPVVPRVSLLVGVFVGVMALLWFLWLSSVSDELAAAQEQEVQLKDDYRKKLAQAINLEELKKQLEQVRQYVNQLEKQLPSKAEMDALLSDINQAGLGRSLQFDLFKPGQVAVKDYYAELPITLKVNGSYHDIGMFASDIAHLSRIVTLGDIALTPVKDKPGMLVMEGVAKTYRYLDGDEVAAQKKAMEAKAGQK
jgi:type IV pilus assembly protein PilO